MPNPDVEKVYKEYFRVYFRGRIFDVNRVVCGWTITVGRNTTPIYCATDEDDVFAWLKAQATV